MPASWAPDRHDPRKSAWRNAPAEMHLDVAWRRRGHFCLSGLQVRRRQPETKAPLQLIAGPAGQNHGAEPAWSAVATFERHALDIDTYVVDTAAEFDGGTRLRGCRVQLLI